MFGEALFDVFEDGRSVLGGAPFNVAWHLKGLGENPLFISRVGRDALGEKVLRAMSDWGLDASGVQLDSLHPTGTVRVSIDGGQPRYEILPEQAYDFIEAEKALDAASNENFFALHHGTLALRHETSRAALAKLVEGLAIPVFLDPNLRSPWWQVQAVRDALRRATWAKLNREELVTLSSGDSTRGCAGLAAALRADFNLELLVVTDGAGGAVAVDASGCIEVPAAEVESFVDSVGAGDAFDAVVIMGLMHGWGLPCILPRAAQFAAAVCGIRGATIVNPAFYQAQLKQWGAQHLARRAPR
ncbi:MAG: carbohydrate kinase [Candidatus Coatesbacteria bacterium]|nr:carbohydrate kinase [Candidatus Coatesbacteria bacterium]